MLQRFRHVAANQQRSRSAPPFGRTSFGNGSHDTTRQPNSGRFYSAFPSSLAPTRIGRPGLVLETRADDESRRHGRIAVDAFGQPTRKGQLVSTPPVPGDNLKLSIDSRCRKPAKRRCPLAAAAS